MTALRSSIARYLKPASFVLFVALAASTASSQSVRISSKKITYKRPKPLIDFKRTFSVNYPVVRASTPALSKKIERSISYGSVLGLNVQQEIREVQWLEEADYEICYNQRGLLCITLSMNGSGAYPSGTSKTVVVDLRNGSRVLPAAAFRKLAALARLVKRKQATEIKTAIGEIKKDPESGESDPAQLFAEANFTTKDLNEFSIGENGVTFIYDYHFPHVIQALQPEGRFTFTWRDLSEFVNPNGPFAKFIIK